MIYYQVQVQVDADVSADWYEWMVAVHIPDVLATGLFLRAEISQVLEMPTNGPSNWLIRYECASMTDFETYQARNAKVLQKDHTDRYAGRCSANRTLSQSKAMIPAP